MYCYDFHVVLKDVPGEISLCFTISGCPLNCQDCHSPFLKEKRAGKRFRQRVYRGILYRYFGFATCVVFKGGEWHKKELIANLKYAREQGYKTCLYTGLEEVDQTILDQLTWIKTGKWIKSLGGLENPNTNQVFMEVEHHEVLNHLFNQV